MTTSINCSSNEIMLFRVHVNQTQTVCKLVSKYMYVQMCSKCVCKASHVFSRIDALLISHFLQALCDTGICDNMCFEGNQMNRIVRNCISTKVENCVFTCTIGHYRRSLHIALCQANGSKTPFQNCQSSNLLCMVLLHLPLHKTDYSTQCKAACYNHQNLKVPRKISRIWKNITRLLEMHRLSDDH